MTMVELSGVAQPVPVCTPSSSSPTVVLYPRFARRPRRVGRSPRGPAEMRVARARSRRVRTLALSGCLFALAALLFMVAGHCGAPELSWTADRLSTWAARAPHGAWITASMISSALALACLGLLVSQHDLLGTRAATKVVSLLASAGIGGLVLLAAFQEARAGTAPALVRQQAFHEAGLASFLVASWLAVAASGAFVFASARRLGEQLVGATVAGLAPLSFAVMSAQAALPAGLRQRLGLLCLWLALVVLLMLALRGARRGGDESRAE